MTTRILGRGVRFPFRPGAAGGFAYVEGDDVVAQSIQLILSTALGERQMRFGFGSELPTLLFEPISGATLARLEESARSALVDHEKRIRAQSVRADADPDVRSRVFLTVEYVVLATSRRGNIVFPFYLQEQ